VKFRRRKIENFDDLTFIVLISRVIECRSWLFLEALQISVGLAMGVVGREIVDMASVLNSGLV
jgi:hypothetical protein